MWKLFPLLIIALALVASPFDALESAVAQVTPNFGGTPQWSTCAAGTTISGNSSTGVIVEGGATTACTLTWTAPPGGQVATNPAVITQARQAPAVCVFQTNTIADPISVSASVAASVSYAHASATLTIYYICAGL
jgi:hypothetical protein